jgi:hypothetical protein
VDLPSLSDVEKESEIPACARMTGPNHSASRRLRTNLTKIGSRGGAETRRKIILATGEAEDFSSHTLFRATFVTFAQILSRKK